MVAELFNTAVSCDAGERGRLIDLIPPELPNLSHMNSLKGRRAGYNQVNFPPLVGHWRSFVEFGWIVSEMFTGKKKDTKKRLKKLATKTEFPTNQANFFLFCDNLP